MSARLRSAALAVALIGIACRGESTHAPERAQAAAQPALAASDPDSATLTGGDDGADHDSADSPLPPYSPATTLGDPLEIRQAQRSRLVYAEPDSDSAMRGRIPSKETFFIYAERDGPGCKHGWAQVAVAGWICADKTAPSEQAPERLPHLEAGATLPYTYARHRRHDKPETPPIPVYRNAAAFREGEAPVDTLPAYGSYAFTRVRQRGGDRLLSTLDRRIVVSPDLELFEPSEFRGVELDARPLAPDHTLAWAVRWKTMVHAAPDPSSPTVARIRYHDPVEVRGLVVEFAPQPGAKAKSELDEADLLWLEVPAHADAPAGWVRLDDVRRHLPLAPPEPVLGGQVTIDVDLDEQVLSVWIERQAVFATLISSGKRTDRTPTGLYRITSKRAYGKMASRGDAQEPYFVDAVPWAMYFSGRYALHAAYWHDMFGHRMSHGCVNLSPRDARRVFELSTPALPAGWLLIEEHRQDPGALVRVRRSGAQTPDNRAAFE